MNNRVIARPEAEAIPLFGGDCFVASLLTMTEKCQITR